MQSSETYLFILNRTSLYTILLKGTGKASERAEKKKYFQLWSTIGTSTDIWSQ